MLDSWYSYPRKMVHSSWLTLCIISLGWLSKLSFLSDSLCYLKYSLCILKRTRCRSKVLKLSLFRILEYNYFVLDSWYSYPRKMIHSSWLTLCIIILGWLAVSSFLGDSLYHPCWMILSVIFLQWLFLSFFLLTCLGWLSSSSSSIIPSSSFVSFVSLYYLFRAIFHLVPSDNSSRFWTALLG